MNSDKILDLFSHYFNSLKYYYLYENILKGLNLNQKKNLLKFSTALEDDNRDKKFIFFESKNSDFSSGTISNKSVHKKKIYININININTSKYWRKLIEAINSNDDNYTNKNIPKIITSYIFQKANNAYLKFSSIATKLNEPIDYIIRAHLQKLYNFLLSKNKNKKISFNKSDNKEKSEDNKKNFYFNSFKIKLDSYFLNRNYDNLDSFKSLLPTEIKNIKIPKFFYKTKNNSLINATKKIKKSSSRNLFITSCTEKSSAFKIYKKNAVGIKNIKSQPNIFFNDKENLITGQKIKRYPSQNKINLSSYIKQEKNKIIMIKNFSQENYMPKLYKNKSRNFENIKIIKNFRENATNHKILNTSEKNQKYNIEKKSIEKSFKELLSGINIKLKDKKINRKKLYSKIFIKNTIENEDNIKQENLRQFNFLHRKDFYYLYHS